MKAFFHGSPFYPKLLLAACRHRTDQAMPRITQGFYFSSTPDGGVDHDDNNYTLGSSETQAGVFFDRKLKRLQREKAARAHSYWRTAAASSSFQETTSFTTYDYWSDELAERLVDRLDDLRRPPDDSESDQGFALALNVGAGSGALYRALQRAGAREQGLDDFDGDHLSEETANMPSNSPPSLLGGGIRKLVQLDSCNVVLNRDVASSSSLAEDTTPGNEQLSNTFRLPADEETPWPFPADTFDLVMSSGSMHWINQLPSMLSEVRRVLRPDGCFLFNMVGGVTLPELRVSMLLAEQEREGGMSPHVGPFCQVSDLGMLLQRAGFSLPTLDVDDVRLSFPNAMVLMEHLQRMGESNVSLHRRLRTSKDTFLAAACIYDELFSLKDDHHAGSGRDKEDEVEVSVQIISGIGWVPHESQPRPLRRGTATHKVGDWGGPAKTS